MVCMYIYFLQNKGVFGNLTFIEELSCDIFPFDNDLLSMELQNAFKVSKKNNLYNLSVGKYRSGANFVLLTIVEPLQSKLIRIGDLAGEGFKLSSYLDYRTHCAHCKTFNLKVAKINHK